MTEEEIKSLLERYETGDCSAAERAWVERWLRSRSQKLNWDWKNPEQRNRFKAIIKTGIDKQLFASERKLHVVLMRAGIAACLLLCLSTLFWYVMRPSPSEALASFYIEEAVAPGSNSARLTLPNNETVWLDQVPTGQPVEIAGVKLLKLADGSIQYRVDEMPPNEAARNNTVSIPRGAHYHFTLPDGTGVWLNSATTLVFPMAFVGDERLVSLTGEAYFEVAKNPDKPFKVIANGAEITVTGTRFNVMAYGDEQRVVTTLVEGGLDVADGSGAVRLSPGQQAVTSKGSPIVKKNADAELAMAWVHGDFVFEDLDIRTIMKRVERWYNVDVVYQEPLPPIRFGGTYTRNKGIQDLLNYLESLSEIRFKLAGGRVTVMK